MHVRATQVSSPAAALLRGPHVSPGLCSSRGTQGPCFPPRVSAVVPQVAAGLVLRRPVEEIPNCGQARGTRSPVPPLLPSRPCPRSCVCASVPWVRGSWEDAVTLVASSLPPGVGAQASVPLAGAQYGPQGSSAQGCRPVPRPHSWCSYSRGVILRFWEGTEPSFVLRESLGHLQFTVINSRCLWLEPDGNDAVTHWVSGLAVTNTLLIQHHGAHGSLCWETQLCCYVPWSARPCSRRGRSPQTALASGSSDQPGLPWGAAWHGLAARVHAGESPRPPGHPVGCPHRPCSLRHSQDSSWNTEKCCRWV